MSSFESSLAPSFTLVNLVRSLVVCNALPGLNTILGLRSIDLLKSLSSSTPSLPMVMRKLPNSPRWTMLMWLFCGHIHITQIRCLFQFYSPLQRIYSLNNINPAHKLHNLFGIYFVITDVVVEGVYLKVKVKGHKNR